MRLFIPTIGTQIILDQDWTFHLHDEYRNEAVRTQLGLPMGQRWQRYAGEEAPPDEVTLPRGTLLQVDRIYIRKGVSGFDSMTFLIRDCPDARLRSRKKGGQAHGKVLRFWAKLDDVNRVECTPAAV